MRNHKEKNLIQIERGIKSNCCRSSTQKATVHGEQCRAETYLIPFYLTNIRDTVRRNKAMKCCWITQKDDSTFPSLKLIREPGAKLALTFPRAVSCKSRGPTVSPSLPFVRD